MDWNAIRQEYITDETSTYRKLAQKYGVGIATISKHARDEDWAGQREQIKNKAIKKSIEKISDKMASQAVKYESMVEAMTEKLTKAIEEVNPKDSTSIRRLTASLCDLRELLGIKSDADSREQEARIANLRKQADKEDDTATKEVNVTFIGDIEEYSK